jgi:predicted PurR-regulated permease PerM
MNESRAYTIAFTAVVFVAIAALVFTVMRPFLPALAWAIVLAVTLWPLWTRIRQRFPKRRSLAAAVLTVVTALVLILPAALLAAALVSQAVDAVGAVSNELRSRNLASLSDVTSLPWVRTALAWLEEHAGLTAVNLQEKALVVVSATSSFLAAKSGGFVLSFVDAILSFLMTLFLLFFFLRDGESLVRAFAEMLPLAPAARTRLVMSLQRMLQSIFRGSLLCAFIQGATGGLGWWFAGLPSAILAAAAMAALSLLPVGGTALVFLPGSIWLWLSGRHGAAIFLFLWGVLVTSVLADNFLKPWLIGGSEELSTLVVFLGVFGGLPAFGILGVFIGPMSLAVAVMLVDALRALAKDSPPAATTPPT